VLEVKSVGNGLKFDVVTRINTYSVAGHVKRLFANVQAAFEPGRVKKKKQSEPAIGLGH